MFAFSLAPDMVFTHTHPLSEIAATIPFLLAVCWLETRPTLAGIMLGVCFGIRFQMGFLIGGMLVLAGLPNRFRLRGPFLRLVLASLGTFLALGIADWVVLGWPFKSPVQYFYANILQGMSKQWGVHPWHQYFDWLWEYCGFGAVVLLALMAVGGWHEWRLGFLLGIFVLAHMAVAHKEERFMLPIAPLALALAAVGLATLLRYLRRGWEPAALITVMVGLGALFALRALDFPWEADDRYRSTSLLLYDAGQQPDATGVGVLGYHLAFYGNYFFLQRDIPLLGVYEPEKPYFPDDPTLADRRINYIIMPPRFVEYYSHLTPVLIKSRGEWGLYRLDRSAS